MDLLDDGNFVTFFKVNIESVGELIDEFAVRAPDLCASDGICEMEICERPYDGQLSTVFVEDGEYGAHFFKPLDESGENFDQQIAFPVRLEDLKSQLYEFLVHQLKLTTDARLIAATEGNPDEWPMEYLDNA